MSEPTKLRWQAVAEYFLVFPGLALSCIGAITLLYSATDDSGWSLSVAGGAGFALLVLFLLAQHRARKMLERRWPEIDGKTSASSSAKRRHTVLSASSFAVLCVGFYFISPFW